MKLLDSRRVTGPGLLLDGPGAVVDVALDAPTRDRAIEAWRDPVQWQRIQANGMRSSFGWEQSAARYLAVYQQAIDRAAA